MQPERGILGSASVRHNDYIGTAAADDAYALPSTDSVYEIAALDRDRWTIVSVKIQLSAGTPHVTIYAFDRAASDVRSRADIEQLASGLGELPVTAFHLETAAQAQRFLSQAFRSVSVHLIAQGIGEHVLAVKETQ